MLDDILTSIFRSAYPDKSDDEIASQVNGLKAAPADALHKAMAFIPGIGAATQFADAAPAAADSIGNSVGNSHTVQDAASSVLNPSTGNPVSDLSQGLVSGATKDMLGSPEATPMASHPTHGVTGSWDAPPTPPTVDATAPNSAVAAPKSGADALLPSQDKMDQDDNARKAMLEAENKKRMLGGIASFGAGVGDAISNAASAFGTNAHSDKQAEVEKTLNNQEVQHKEQFEAGLKNDPNSDISKHYQKVLGLMMGKHPDDPALTHMSAATIAQTLPEVEKYMQKELQVQALKANKDINLGFRHDSEQDKLEQNARQGFMSMRGDQSLQRIESQRDASSQAFSTIAQLKKEGRMPSQIEYYDLLGQMWKARTGSAPTDQAIRDLDAKTFKGDLGKAQQYFTGAPAGRTTEAVLNNIQAFAQQSGEYADKLHAGYMATRMIKPKNLDDSRWEPLAQAGRGLSFADATKQSNTTPTAQPTKTINGRNFVSKNGQWYEVK